MNIIYFKMMRKYASAALLWGVAMGAFALSEKQNPDSLKVEELNEVVVKAVKAPANAPFAVANPANLNKNPATSKCSRNRKLEKKCVWKG